MGGVAQPLVPSAHAGLKLAAPKICSHRRASTFNPCLYGCSKHILPLPLPCLAVRTSSGSLVPPWQPRRVCDNRCLLSVDGRPNGVVESAELGDHWSRDDARRHDRGGRRGDTALPVSRDATHVEVRVLHTHTSARPEALCHSCWLLVCSSSAFFFVASFRFFLALFLVSLTRCPVFGTARRCRGHACSARKSPSIWWCPRCEAGSRSPARH